jgi:hypothetical protein
LILILPVTIVYIIWSLLFNTVSTIYNVSIDTEYIEFKTTDNNNSRLILVETYVSDNLGLHLSDYEGALELNAGVDVSIERISLGGIELSLTCDNCESVGRLYKSETELLDAKLGKSADLYIQYTEDNSKVGETHLFRIDGIITAGRSIAFEQMDESNAVLRGGNVRLVGLSKVKNKYFSTNEVEVNMGDQLVFEKLDSKSFGFVTINETPGMKAVYRVMAKQMRVIRPGPRSAEGGQTFAVSYIDGLYHDRFFKVLTLVIGALIFFITVFTFFMDYSQYQNSTKKLKDE